MGSRCEPRVGRRRLALGESLFRVEGIEQPVAVRWYVASTTRGSRAVLEPGGWPLLGRDLRDKTTPTPSWGAVLLCE